MNADLSIGYTLFQDVSAQQVNVKTSSWEELSQRIRNPSKTYPSKAACPLIKLAIFGEQRTPKGSLRHDDNVVEITGLEGDYDGEEMPITEAAMLLNEHNVEAVLYTSPSHRLEAPRWRVLLPLSHPYPPKERTRLLARVNGALTGVLGSESFTLSQSYYIGRVNGAPYQVQQVRGQCIDLLDELDERAVGPAHNGKRLPTPPVGDMIPEGRRNATLTSLAGSMRRRGASQGAIEAALLVENAKCTPPLPEHEVRAIAASVAQYEPKGSTMVASSDPKIREAVACLAALAQLDYELVREKEAEKLGVRVSALDGAVKEQRDERGSTGQAPMFQEVDLWPTPVDGGQLLESLSASVRRHVVLPKHVDVAIALWAVFTYLLDAAGTAPMLALLSPEKRCGKTTLLSWLARVVNRPLPASNVSPPAVFRSIEKWCPTLLVDEADSFLGDNEELRGVLNSGHTRDAVFILRCVGDDHEPQRFSTWSPKALALIGKLSDTLQDRSIVIELRRRLPGEEVKKLRLTNAGHFEQLRSQCLRFASDQTEPIRQARPAIPEGLNDRSADNWEPLLAIAEAAGGDWPRLARVAARVLSGSEHESASIGTELLVDIRKAFGAKDRMLSGDLIEALSSDHERPWATFHHGKAMTQRQLANRLRVFGIISKTVRDGDDRAKGYLLADFSEAFQRYVVPLEGNTPPFPSVPT